MAVFARVKVRDHVAEFGDLEAIALGPVLPEFVQWHLGHVAGGGF